MTTPLSKTIAIFAACQILSGSAFGLTPFSTKFNTAKLDSSRWTLKNYAKGKLAPASGRIQFTVAKPPTGDDYSTLELRNNQPGFNESWQVILDVANTQNAGYDVGTGIMIFNASDPKDTVSLEFYGAAKKGGFYVIGITNDNDNPSGDIVRNPKVDSGSMRISFDKNTKLFTFWYDQSGSADGFQWVKICTYSPTGKGGDRRGDWNMNAGGGRFGIKLFGFSDGQVITAGKVSFDNFALKAAK